MNKHQIPCLAESPLFQQLQHPCPGLAGVYRVQQNALGPGQLLQVGGVLRVGHRVSGPHVIEHGKVPLPARKGVLQQLRRAGGQLGHDLLKGFVIHADACNLRLRQLQRRPQQQSGGGPAGAGGADQMGRAHAGRLCLFGDLPDADHVAQRPQVGGPPHRNGIGPMALFRQLRAASVHGLVDVLVIVGVKKTDLGAIEIIQHQIAPVVRNAPLFQQQLTPHPKPRGTGGGEHSVVGLGAAGGEHRVAAPAFGVRQQKFQLADLVSSQSHAAKIVPLDPDVPAVAGTDALQLVEGGGEHSQVQPGQFIDMLHHAISSLFSQPRSWAIRAGMSSAL